VDYSEESLVEARTSVIRGYRALQLLKELQDQSTAKTGKDGGKNAGDKAEDYINKFEKLKAKFDEAMDDDFNTAQALGHVFDMVRMINNFGVEEKNMSTSDKVRILAAARNVFDHFGSVLGVFHGDADQFFVDDQKTELKKRDLNVADIENMVRQRQIARENKDWTKADEIRKELAKLHIVLKDSAGGTRWIVE